jgi:hypothetical protein
MGLPLNSSPLREFRMWWSWSLVTSVNILLFVLFIKIQVMVQLLEIPNHGYDISKCRQCTSIDWSE